MKWIDIKEKLPEIGQEILCFNGIKVVMAIYDSHDWKIQKYPSGHDRTMTGYWTNVVYWMELPIKPE